MKAVESHDAGDGCQSLSQSGFYMMRKQNMEMKEETETVRREREATKRGSVANPIVLSSQHDPTRIFERTVG